MGQLRIITHEREGRIVQFDGRVIRWLMTPENSGSEYTSVCTAVYEVGKRAKPAHAHPNGEETIYVTSGNGKVKVGDLISEIEPGSLVFFPQGVPHMVWNCGSGPLSLVCFYAPVKEATSYEFYDDFDFPEFKSQVDLDGHEGK